MCAARGPTAQRDQGQVRVWALCVVGYVRVPNGVVASMACRFGEIVWAKMGGYPFWPSLITDPRLLPDKLQKTAMKDLESKFFLYFYATKNLYVTLIALAVVSPLSIWFAWRSDLFLPSSVCPVRLCFTKTSRLGMTRRSSTERGTRRKTPRHRSAGSS